MTGVYSEIVEVPSDAFYGKGYQDIYTRKPSIEQAGKLLGWEPKIGLEDSLKMTIYSFLEENRVVSLLLENHARPETERQFP